MPPDAEDSLLETDANTVHLCGDWIASMTGRILVILTTLRQTPGRMCMCLLQILGFEPRTRTLEGVQFLPSMRRNQTAIPESASPRTQTVQTTTTGMVLIVRGPLVATSMELPKMLNCMLCKSTDTNCANDNHGHGT